MSSVVGAERMRHVPFPASQAVMSRVRELRRQGRDIIDFGTKGPTPAIARQAAIRMLETGPASAYTDVRGLLELREAIARKLAAENAIAADPATDIVVTLGGKEGVFSTLLALVDRGDEVLIEDPGWLAFEPMVRIAGATPVPVPLDPAHGFRFSPESLRDRVTPRTRLLILCNPHNPTGAVLTRSELEAIAEASERHGFLVLVDEAYENFVYDGRRHVSLASLPGMWQRTVTVQTTSKIYNMFGWRVGWTVAPKALIDPILTVHSHSVTCPTSFAQAGAIAVLQGGVCEADRPIAEVIARYQSQRDAMVAGLRRIPGVTCTLPEGAYFAFPNLAHFGRGSAELAHYLLETAGIATTPGAAFGAVGEDHLRLVFNAPVPEIEKGLARMRDALAALSSPTAALAPR